MYSPDQGAEANTVVQNQDGFLLAGYTYSTGQPDAWILQTDAAGNELWTKTILNDGWDQLNYVTVDGSGQMWLGGLTYINDTQLYDHFLLTTHGVLDLILTAEGQPIVIPPGGGSIDYSARVTNQAAQTITFDLWTLALLPGGFVYGPILNHQDISLQPGYFYLINPSQNVPAGAPPGEYEYIVRLGALNEFVYTEARFNFTKSQN